MAIIDNNNHYGFDTYWCICPLLITINETYWKKITVQSANIIMITHNYLDYIQYIQNKYNFNLVLNDDKVTCCLILTGKLFHKNTPLCRITFDDWNIPRPSSTKQDAISIIDRMVPAICPVHIQTIHTTGPVVYLKSCSKSIFFLNNA